MYRDHWKLNLRPFENNFDTRFLFPGSGFQAAELKLRYAIENRLGAAMLTGAGGCGKTFLTCALMEALPDTFGPFVRIDFPQFSAKELLSYLAAELSDGEDSPVTTDAPLDHIVRRIARELKRHAMEGRHPVVLVEDAHAIEDPRVLGALQLLLNRRWEGDGNFTLLLLGDPLLVPRIRRAGSLADRIAVACLLPPLSQDETTAYVEHRLQVAGASRAVFEAGALKALFELSGGVPLRINHLCELSLLVGFAERTDSISAPQVEAVADELVAIAA